MKNLTNPLLSIVVPTMNRYYHLVKLIEHIDTFSNVDLELVIQDNTEDNHYILDYLERKNRRFLVYRHTKERLSISDNVDLAIGNSSGEYICFIGDDDGVMPSIIECTKWMRDHEVDAAIFANIIYNWPDYYSEVNTGTDTGALFYDNFSFKVNLLNPIHELRKIAGSGFTNLHGLPKLYQGIVSRKSVDAVYLIGKTYTPGPSPDMATAVALAFIAKRFVKISIPVIITGQSANVGAGERKLAGRTKNLKEVDFISEVAKSNWSSLIPRVWCTQTVWPESAIKAIEYMGKSSEIKVSFAHILARIVQNYPLEFLVAYKHSNNRLYFLILCGYFIIGRRAKKAYHFLRSVFNNLDHKSPLCNKKNGLNTLHDSALFIKENCPQFCEAGITDKLIIEKH